MLTLGPTNTLSVVLSAPKTTTEPTFAASYFDGSSTGIVGEGVSQGQTSGTTPVVMLTSPASGNFRHISSLFFNNLDSAPVTMSLLLDTRVIFGPVLLQPGDCITGERGGGGPRVVSMNGSVRQVSSAAWGSLIGTLSSQTDLAAALAGKVSTSLTVAGHALTGNVTITAADVGADAAGAAAAITLAGLGGIPTTQKGAASGVATLDGTTKVPYAQLPTGTSANTVLPGNDASVTNARTPTAHASSHVTGGSDVIANVVAAGNAGLMTGSDKTKLDGVSGSNTGDQTLGGLGGVPTSTTVNGHALSSNVTITASDLSLGNVTNDVQTKAAIVPNTTPAAGALLVGNAGATAYASVSVTGDVTINSSGVTAIKSSPTLTTPTISGLLTPATVAGIKGTAAADSAQAGSIGEVITSTVATGSSVSLTSVTSANVTSIALTAGDWDVWGCGCFTLGSTTTMGYLSIGINATSATMPANNAGVGTIPGAGTNATTDVTVDPVVGVAPIRVNISSSATYYLVARAKFGTSTCKAYGTIYARRRR